MRRVGIRDRGARSAERGTRAFLALSGRSSGGSARAHLLGRAGVVRRAHLRDVGAGRAADLTEQLTHQVGANPVQLREPLLGLGGGDVGCRLARFRSRTAAARGSCRRSAVRGQHRRDVREPIVRSVGLGVFVCRSVFMSSVRRLVGGRLGSGGPVRAGVIGRLVLDSSRVVVRLAFVERVSDAGLCAQPKRRRAASHGQPGCPIGLALDLLGRTCYLSAIATLLRHVGELVRNEPVAVGCARLVRPGPEVNRAVLRDGFGRPRRGWAVGHDRHARQLHPEQAAQPSALRGRQKHGLRHPHERLALRHRARAVPSPGQIRLDRRRCLCEASSRALRARQLARFGEHARVPARDVRREPWRRARARRGVVDLDAHARGSSGVREQRPLCAQRSARSQKARFACPASSRPAGSAASRHACVQSDSEISRNCPRL